MIEGEVVNSVEADEDYDYEAERQEYLIEEFERKRSERIDRLTESGDFSWDAENGYGCGVLNGEPCLFDWDGSVM